MIAGWDERWPGFAEAEPARETDTVHHQRPATECAAASRLYSAPGAQLAEYRVVSAVRMDAWAQRMKLLHGIHSAPEGAGRATAHCHFPCSQTAELTSASQAQACHSA